jgi:hypothetical protein
MHLNPWQSMQVWQCTVHGLDIFRIHGKANLITEQVQGPLSLTLAVRLTLPQKYYLVSSNIQADATITAECRTTTGARADALARRADDAHYAQRNSDVACCIRHTVLDQLWVPSCGQAGVQAAQAQPADSCRQVAVDVVDCIGARVYESGARAQLRSNELQHERCAAPRLRAVGITWQQVEPQCWWNCVYRRRVRRSRGWGLRNKRRRQALHAQRAHRAGASVDAPEFTNWT